jgi:alanine dehydrogenase
MRFRLLSETDVKAVLTIDDLIETMASALAGFSAGRVDQPVRTVISIEDPGGPSGPGNNAAFFGTMPALTRNPAALGAKLVTVFGSNAAKGLPSHLASILLLDPETGALRALLDGRYITEARTAAVSAVSSRLLARPTAKSLAIIGSGVQARSHLEALSRVHTFSHVTVWSPNKSHRDRFADDARAESDRRRTAVGPRPEPNVSAVDHPGEAVVGADVIVLATSSPTPVLESGWVKPGAHIICVGACRPTQREIDPALTARARVFVDSRAAALVESGDIVMGIQEGRFGPDHIVAELGELAKTGRRSDSEITIFKSLGMAVEDVAAADLAYRRAVEKGLGQELTI